MQAPGSAISWFWVILDLPSCIAIEHPSALGLLVTRGALLAAKPAEVGHRDGASSKQFIWRRRVSVALGVSSCQQFPALFTNDVRKAPFHHAERSASGAAGSWPRTNRKAQTAVACMKLLGHRVILKPRSFDH